MIGRLRAADHGILMLNLVLLLTIGRDPVRHRAAGHYLKEGQGQNLAAAIYGGVLLADGDRVHDPELAHPVSQGAPAGADLYRGAAAGSSPRSVIGLAPYVLATALAAVSPYPTLAICAGLAIYYALPLASSFEA